MGNNMNGWATTLVRWATTLVGVAPTLVRWATTLVAVAQANNQGDEGTQLNSRGDQGKQVTTDPNNHHNQFNNEGGNKLIQGNKESKDNQQDYYQGNGEVNNHCDNGDIQVDNGTQVRDNSCRNVFINKGSNELKQEGSGSKQGFYQGNGKVNNHGDNGTQVRNNNSGPNEFNNKGSNE
jgi:hypothetical protein